MVEPQVVEWRRLDAVAPFRTRSHLFAPNPGLLLLGLMRRVRRQLLVDDVPGLGGTDAGSARRGGGGALYRRGQGLQHRHLQRWRLPVHARLRRALVGQVRRHIPDHRQSPRGLCARPAQRARPALGRVGTLRHHHAALLQRARVPRRCRRAHGQRRYRPGHRLHGSLLLDGAQRHLCLGRRGGLHGGAKLRPLQWRPAQRQRGPQLLPGRVGHHSLCPMVGLRDGCRGDRMHRHEGGALVPLELARRDLGFHAAVDPPRFVPQWPRLIFGTLRLPSSLASPWSRRVPFLLLDLF
mmetsp:Transcript_1024/g.3037  ORF Transcript_1024/g.3037 Transcript_1024/m.3037 type:complete len:295 (-) Transcript_1024:131-1015(-)